MATASYMMDRNQQMQIVGEVIGVFREAKNSGHDIHPVAVLIVGLVHERAKMAGVC
jgi:hypothetical protein